MPIFFQTALGMVALLLVLAVLTSMVTGISFFDKQIMSVLTTILVISLVILGVMALILFIGALIMNRNTTVSRTSTLIKDGTIRYEGVDEKGRKRKKNVDLKHIDEFLSKYSQLYMIKDTTLAKADPKAKSNVNTLIVTLADGRQLSLKKLNDEDPELYNQIGAFLDKIKDKDQIDLSFRMRRYAMEEDIVLKGREVMEQLKDLKRKVSNKQVRDRITEMIDKLKEKEELIPDNADKIRKLYDHYLPMLAGIIEDYITMEGHKIADITASRNKLLETFALIENALDSFGVKEDIEYFDELEAESETLATAMKDVAVQQDK